MKRLLTAALLIPFVVYTVLWANPWVFLAVVALAAALSYREYDAIAAAYGFGAPGPLGYGAGLALLLIPPGAWLVVTGAALVALALALRSAELARSLPRTALLVLGVVYVFGCWRCAIVLHSHGPHWLMYALVVSWSGDIGAYYAGRAWGRHKLAARISPQKSWEGAGASVAASVLLAGAYLVYFVGGVTIAQAAVLSAAGNVAGQFGDLVESAMKRGASMKDSGGLLPGHGGFLDRVDSTLFVMPAIAAWLIAGAHGL